MGIGERAHIELAPPIVVARTEYHQSFGLQRGKAVAQRRFVLLLVGIFGVLALVLAAIGVYGVMSLLVSERTQEVGVRLALGANPSQVLKMLVAQATRLALVGVAIGVVISIGGTSLNCCVAAWPRFGTRSGCSRNDGRTRCFKTCASVCECC